MCVFGSSIRLFDPEPFELRGDLTAHRDLVKMRPRPESIVSPFLRTSDFSVTDFVDRGALRDIRPAMVPS
jgi:hypothetical protein